MGVMNIGDIQFHGDSASFRHEGRRYIYAALTGKMYVGAHGTPVHWADDGSFEISNRRTYDEVLAHAVLLGARVYPAPSS